MKEFLKKISPDPLLQLARNVYWGIYWRISNKKWKRPTFTKMRFNSQPVLKCSIAYNKYGGYCVPMSSSHRPAAQKVLFGDIYEPETIEFLIAHCSNGDIVHAGTFFGDFLPALSQSCSPGSKIWAFEPNPESYKCSQITIYINGLKNVELTNAGLGEKRELLVMVTTDEEGRGLGGGSRILAENERNISEGTETVQIVAIDEVVPPERTVSIIQLDVEGHEQQALSGALKTIRRCLPIIILEIWPESALLNSAWFLENISQLGYHESGSFCGNIVFMHRPNLGQGNN